MKKTTKFFIVLIVTSSLSIQSKNIFDKSNKIFFSNKYFSHPKPKQNSKPKSFKDKIQDHALWQTKQQVIYDGSYVKLDYPGGDVSSNRGVCTDVVIRALRAVDVDLQKEIHEDLKKDLNQYNKRYKTKHIDSSIDHRRTQNIETYLERKGCRVKYSKKSSELKYQKGDIVFFNIAYGHVGIVTDIFSEGNKTIPLLVHNIGSGPVLDDFLSTMPVSGHYRLSEAFFE